MHILQIGAKPSCRLTIAEVALSVENTTVAIAINSSLNNWTVEFGGTIRSSTGLTGRLLTGQALRVLNYNIPSIEIMPIVHERLVITSQPEVFNRKGHKIHSGQQVLLLDHHRDDTVVCLTSHLLR